MAILGPPPLSLENAVALAQLVVAAITVGTLVVAIFAFRFSRRQHIDALSNFEREYVAAINNFEKTLKVTYYAELDRMYFDLVAMRVGKPHLWGGPTKPAKPTKEQALEALEYEHYRFLVWNYLETVFDRCIVGKDGEPDDDLHRTWGPAFEFESRLHGKTIGAEHADCFKQDFRDYLAEER